LGLIQIEQQHANAAKLSGQQGKHNHNTNSYRSEYLKAPST